MVDADVKKNFHKNINARGMFYSSEDLSICRIYMKCIFYLDVMYSETILWALNYQNIHFFMQHKKKMIENYPFRSGHWSLSDLGMTFFIVLLYTLRIMSTQAFDSEVFVRKWREEYYGGIWSKYFSQTMGHISPLPVGIPRVELNNLKKKRSRYWARDI